MFCVYTRMHNVFMESLFFIWKANCMENNSNKVRASKMKWNLAEQQ